MRSHKTVFKRYFFLALGAAACATVILPEIAAAQSYSTGGMRAPSVNMGSVGPRAPEFRMPRTYSTQSFSTPESKPRQKPKTRSLKPDESKAPEPAAQTAQRRSGGTPPANERRFVPNEVVIEVDGRPSTQAVDALAQRHRLTRVESQTFELTGTTMFRWTIPDGRSVRQVIRGLEADRSVRSVQPNYQYQLQQTAHAYGDPAQYALGKLRLAEAHNLTKGDRILVAVIDSGIDASHPELAGVIADSFNSVGGGGEPHTHGTGIAGTIAAHSRLMGVAPRAKILAVRAFDPSGSGAQGTTFSILRGLEWAVTKGARVINMSFAGPQDPALSRALAGAHKKGVALIAAAGNAGPKSPPLYPAADPNVIAVTATDAEDKLFRAANRGNHVAVSAPGVDILVPSPGAGYQVTSGTSFASAHVSGIAALVLERDPGLSPDGLRRVLLSSAKDLGPKGRDKDFGMGLADAYRAVVSADGKNEAISSNDADAR
ncbi:MAG: S8 family serine peptidase [Pseudorhodoplanes sp.]|nr:S8 family serine peptidase [Pseudorhodoplanes sp.]